MFLKVRGLCILDLADALPWYETTDAATPNAPLTPDFSYHEMPAYLTPVNIITHTSTDLTQRQKSLKAILEPYNLRKSNVFTN